MVNKIPSLLHLYRTLQQVPFLASKNLYKVATYFLKEKDEKVADFCKSLLQARKNIVACEKCAVWYEKKQSCLFCSDPKRDQSIICIVESWQELMTIERTGGFNGVYHILGGAICPLDGIGPEDLTIGILLSRVDETTKEIILATNQTPEGEATAAFIARKLKDSKVSVSCLARGIPIGSSLEFIDKLTVYKALSERRPF